MQKSDHITQIRQAVDSWLSAQDKLTALRREYDALDLGNQFTDTDFIGDNAGLTGSDISAVYTTLAAELSLMAQGHATNLYKVSQYPTNSYTTSLYFVIKLQS